jgi:hypothetical protein
MSCGFGPDSPGQLDQGRQRSSGACAQGERVERITCSDDNELPAIELEGNGAVGLIGSDGGVPECLASPGVHGQDVC